MKMVKMIRLMHEDLLVISVWCIWCMEGEVLDSCMTRVIIDLTAPHPVSVFPWQAGRLHQRKLTCNG